MLNSDLLLPVGPGGLNQLSSDLVVVVVRRLKDLGKDVSGTVQGGDVVSGCFDAVDLDVGLGSSYNQANISDELEVTAGENSPGTGTTRDLSTTISTSVLLYKVGNLNSTWNEGSLSIMCATSSTIHPRFLWPSPTLCRCSLNKMW